MISEDTDLVINVQLKATGANVHRVNNALQIYRQLINLANEDPTVTEVVGIVERRLRVFACTGCLNIKEVECRLKL